MKSKLKQLALALTVGLGLASSAKALTSTDTLVITITPNAYYAVEITTITSALNLGTVALGLSTQTVVPATVTILSTFYQTDLKLKGDISSAGTAWAFDANTGSQEQDSLAAWATFTSVARSSAPAQAGDYFEGTTPAAGSDLVNSTLRYAGTSATNGADVFENESGFDLVDLDSMNPNEQAHLWFYFRLPSATTSPDAQNITITITAQGIN